MNESKVNFEEGFMYRSNKSITSRNDIALTELIANAWDAGATSVALTIPDTVNKPIIIEDDGIGMTDQEFRERWMTLNYDRQRRQGIYVEFPPDAPQTKRIAYGRNGVGRHGMLCFSYCYTVETWKKGVRNTYRIEMSEGESPFRIASHKTDEKDGHGTRISTTVEQHLPGAAEMTDILSARFMFDPNFTVSINGNVLDLSTHKGLIYEDDFVTDANARIHMIVIDSEKTAAKSQQHGVAFWVSGRLVGNPAWSHGKITFLDGRLKIAKRYTIIIQSNDLIHEVLPDWSGFVDSPTMMQHYISIKQKVDAFIKSAMLEYISEVQLEAIRETRDELETLNIEGQRNVSALLERITNNNPTVSPEYLKLAIEAMAAIEKSKKGEALLYQICQMTPDQMDRLSDILNTWNVDEIAAVMGEIDRRLTVIEAIERLYRDKNTDELHTLHPLVLNARWLFGAQFDSPMFVSNSALTTVIQKLFREDEYDLSQIENPKRRPDVVCLNTMSLKAVCTEKMDLQASEIMKPDHILIIEVKRGGFEITDKEVNQTEYYVRQIRKSGTLYRHAEIDAFVVGAELGDIDPEKETSSGRIHAVTYGSLVDTARAKLFGLQKKLKEHYDAMDSSSIVENALKEEKQLKLRNI